MLLLLNGPPAVGKSVLARRWVDGRPLALVVEVDQLRSALGGWVEHDESKAVARELALVLVEAQLSAGRDVVVPQLLGRVDFIERLEQTAHRLGVPFVEVLLLDDADALVRRFRSRRLSLQRAQAEHPSDEVADDRVADEVEAWLGALEAVRDARPSTRVVHAHGDLDETARLLADEVRTAMLDGDPTEPHRHRGA